MYANTKKALKSFKANACHKMKWIKNYLTRLSLLVSMPPLETMMTREFPDFEKNEKMKLQKKYFASLINEKRRNYYI